MADKTLNCKDCGAEFVFTEGEQAFTQKKDSPMSRFVALIAVARESNSAITTVDTVTTTDGNHLLQSLINQRK